MQILGAFEKITITFFPSLSNIVDVTLHECINDQTRSILNLVPPVHRHLM